MLLRCMFEVPPPIWAAIDTIVNNSDEIVRIAGSASDVQIPPPPDWLANTPLIGSRLHAAWQNAVDNGARELLVQRRRAGEAEHVGDQRIFGKLLQRRFGDLRQRMVLRHDDLPMPRIDRQQHEVRELVLAAGVDGEIDAIERRHLGDLVGGALVQVQLHVGIFLAEIAYYARQHVARLRVRRGDGERPDILAAIFVGHALHVGDLAQRPPGGRDHDLARRRQRGQPLALAHEHPQPEFVLELANLLADAGLRGEQRQRGLGDIETMVDHGAQVFELLEIHRAL